MRGDLAVPERAEAGKALAHLGDPRFRADAWYLPDEPLLGFVEIPAGSFVMESDNHADSTLLAASPRHDIFLPTYYMARSPATVAQFRAFVEASGYHWERGDQPQGPPNHPVVQVSWHDAMAYCAWLTARLQAWAQTPEPLATWLRKPGWCVTLGCQSI